MTTTHAMDPGDLAPEEENPRPWDIGECRYRMRLASRAHRDAADARKTASAQLADAERTYKMALAKKMTRLKAQGIAQTVAGDLARGDEEVAELRHRRDVCRGVVQAADIYAKACLEDRHDVREHVRWSRDVAPNGEQREPEQQAAVSPIGRRAA